MFHMKMCLSRIFFKFLFFFSPCKEINSPGINLLLYSLGLDLILFSQLLYSSAANITLSPHSAIVINLSSNTYERRRHIVYNNDFYLSK